AEDGIRDFHVTGVQTCALPICRHTPRWKPTIRAAAAGARCRRCRAAATAPRPRCWTKRCTWPPAAATVAAARNWTTTCAFPVDQAGGCCCAVQRGGVGKGGYKGGSAAACPRPDATGRGGREAASRSCPGNRRGPVQNERELPCP